MEEKGAFWDYLSQTQKDLLHEGTYLRINVIKGGNYQFKDYSFLIFPYAKAYEGYLKQLFLDIKFISHLDYISDHFRLGKMLSPHLIGRLGDRSLFKKIQDQRGSELAERIWQTWKLGRNEIFHYFPHNLKAVSFPEAEKIIENIVETMELSYRELITLRHQASNIQR